MDLSFFGLLLDPGLPAVLEITAFRALPFAGYFIVASGHRWTARLSALGVYLLLVLCLASYSPRHILQVIGYAIGYGYYVLVGCSAPPLSRLLASGLVGRCTLFAYSACAFVVAPILLVPAASTAALHIVGWELALSYYSLCAEASRSRTPSRREALWFLLVNPSLVYPERGRRLEGRPPGMGWLRVLGGVATLLSAVALVSFVRDPRRFDGLQALLARDAIGPAAALVSGILVAEYWAHSGVASIQIGLMRLVGYWVPERYNLPFMASSPADFWRRWNIYVGRWFRRYLFAPLALRLARAARGRHGRLPLALSVMVTFLFVGLLHDGLVYLQYLHFSVRSTVGFALCGTALILWEGLSRVRSTRARQGGALSCRLFDIGASLASRSAWISLLLAGIIAYASLAEAVAH